ncbi:MAG: helix-turn-helix domain-containing protein [Candidatus Woesearchaeota archaeon]
MQIEIKALKSLGLNDKEALTYFDLVMNGESKTGKICKRTNIPSSQIYTLLGSLLEKGLVRYKLVNNIKIFSASDPQALKTLFEEKEKSLHQEKEMLLQFITSLKKLPLEKDKITDFKYFYGIKGVKSLYTEIIHSWKSGDEYCIASAPLASFSQLEGFFVDIVHAKRIADGVRLKMIVNLAAKDWGAVREQMPLTQVRYLPITTLTEYGILHDYFFLVSYAEQPYGLLIKDKHFAQTYRVFFSLLWDLAKPRSSFSSQ